MVLVNYYDSLRQVLEAMSLLEGYKVYSHEAYYYYLKEKKEYSIAEKFTRLRKLRNGANYYGEGVSINVSKAAKNDVIDIRKKLIDKYLNN